MDTSKLITSMMVKRPYRSKYTVFAPTILPATETSRFIVLMNN